MASDQCDNERRRLAERDADTGLVEGKRTRGGHLRGIVGDSTTASAAVYNLWACDIRLLGPLWRRHGWSFSLKKAGQNAALMLMSMILLATAGEIVLRIRVLFSQPKFTLIDPILGWSHNARVSYDMQTEGHAYTLSYNNHGYRGSDIEFAKDAAVRRVVFLGDSFVDAAEVGDTEVFTALLQDSLDGLEVINLGVYGHSTAQKLISLENVGLRFDPDLVVLVTVSNDFVENVTNFDAFGPRPRFVLDEARNLRLEGTDHPNARETFERTNIPLPGMAFLHQHSLLYYALNSYIYHRLFAERILTITKAQETANSPEYRHELFLRLISRMDAVCKARGIRFVAVFAYWRNELLTEESPMKRAILDVAAAGIRVADLHEPLRRAELSGGESLYYRQDPHWNAFGNSVVAATLRPLVVDWLNGSH